MLATYEKYEIHITYNQYEANKNKVGCFVRLKCGPVSYQRDLDQVNRIKADVHSGEFNLESRNHQNRSNEMSEPEVIQIHPSAKLNEKPEI